ncbi:tellurium resistance protein [Malaciobacter halophilus]|uniref:Tellurium resistance protein n=1 Tax=Malaciobacter halophilus TaxID=197482 RepID=A0A2N1J358_9BACT|nr:class I SAM-dependent methyltransferase [Malaciobacter halophilus]AXH08577.1 putative tellurite resistance protein TehB [Malaciobacter halophilus]PKI80998.1 tellurium resistance protein [Malaciobacter halophilus]
MTQQELWNKKFSRDGYLYGTNVNEFLKSCENLFSSSKNMLCLGEGEGRNAVYFAKKGFSVDAIDASNVGLEKLKKEALKNSLEIDTLCIDLEEWIPLKKYDVIVTSYLHIPIYQRDKLFDKIELSLENNGYFIGEFFSKEQMNYFSGGPKDLDLLYEVDDFINRFNLCEKISVKEQLVYLNEGKGHQGEASVIRVVLKKR